MKIPTWTITLLISVLLLTGCQRHYAITVYNNSGEDLTVVLKDGTRVEWQAARALRITSHRYNRDIHPGYMPSGYNKDEEFALVLVVDTNTGVKRYWLLHPRLPDEYQSVQSGLWERFFQLEDDGNLYIVKVGSTYPVDPLPPQPEGLPIKPGGG